jgi:hypothetical protein
VFVLMHVVKWTQDFLIFRRFSTWACGTFTQEDRKVHKNRSEEMDLEQN